MKNHTKIYMDALGYDATDFVPSEISGKKANDICHISCRGMGGNPLKDKDRIENLMAQTREEHILYGDKKEYMVFQYKKHWEFLVNNGVKVDQNYFLKMIQKYEN